MKKVEIKKIPKITLGLYIVAALMLIIAIFNIYTSYKYIDGLVMQGFKPGEQITDVIKFYIESVTPYVFYGICLLVLGYMVQMLQSFVKVEERVKEINHYEEKLMEEDEDEEDDIVEELLREK